MSGDRLRVLVVDDEEPIRRFLRVALTSQGYTVFEAASGQEAAFGCCYSQARRDHSRLGLTRYRWC